MSDHFKTHGEAWRYCEKYGLDYISNDVFKIAEALLCAYKDGAKEPVIEAGRADLCDCDVTGFTVHHKPGCPHYD